MSWPGQNINFPDETRMKMIDENYDDCLEGVAYIPEHNGNRDSEPEDQMEVKYLQK